MWDGVIISFAVERRDFRGLQNWFFSSGWELQYFLVRLEDWLAGSTGIGFRTLDRGIAATALAVVVWETKNICLQYFAVSRRWALNAGILVAVFPVWQFLFSSVMTIHLVCLAIGLLSVRLIQHELRGIEFVGYFLAFTSYQLNSLLVFLPIMIFVIGRINSVTSIQSNRWKQRASATLGTALLYYLVRQLLNRPYGAYESYNEIVFPDSFRDILRLGFHTLNFATFLILLLTGALTSLAFKIRECNTGSELASVTSPTGKSRLRRTRTQGASLLVFASVFPYIVVGKSASLIRPWDWEIRQGILLAPALSILVVVLLQYRVQDVTRIQNMRCRLKSQVPFLSVVLISSTFLVMGMGSKLSQLSFEEKLLEGLRKEELSFEGHIVQFISMSDSVPSLSDYEGNFLLYRLSGSAKHFVRFSNEVSGEISIPSRFSSGGDPPSAFAFEVFTVRCRTEVYIDVNGGNETSVFGFRIPPLLGSTQTVEISDIQQRCQ